MKKLIIPVLLLSLTVFMACSSSSDPAEPDHCDGLITDTSGTGDNGRVYLANAFTPNGDGLNDVIRPVTTNIASTNFTIYDANNNVVFNSTTGNSWSSGLPATGTYIKYRYRLQATTSAGHRIGFCGDLYKLNNCRPAGAVLYFEDQLTVNGFTGVTAEMLSVCP